MFLINSVDKGRFYLCFDFLPQSDGTVLDNAISSLWSWDGSVGIPIGYRLEDRGLIIGRGKTFLFSTASRPATGGSLPGG
jgi:hypothetical protein